MKLDTETTISPRVYSFIAGLVYEKSRIHLGMDKHSLVVSRLRKRLGQLGLGTFEEYCDLLRQGDPAELGMLVDLISTNHTQFFREIEHFRYLENTLLPELAKRCEAKAQPARIWSAACSSGEEPYSIAITLAEFARSRPSFQWSVEATDISSRMLQRAQEGVYRQDDLRLPDPTWMKRYFQKGRGDYEGYCRAKPELRERIAFHHLNLFGAQYPVASGVHVIFCRNVMIYFDPPTQQELVSRLVNHLAPGGWLLVGHSESLLAVAHLLRRVKPSIYQRA